MAVSTTTTLTEIIPDIIAEAEWIRQAGEVVRPLVFNKTAPYGQTVVLPMFAEAGTAESGSEGTDYTTTTTLDAGSGASVTPKYIQHIYQVTEQAKLSMPQDIIQLASNGLGQAMARKVEKILVDSFSGFTNIVGSGSGDNLTVHLFEDAIATLEGYSAARPYKFVGGPKQIWGEHGISSIATNNLTLAGNVGTVSDDISRNGLTHIFMGVYIYPSSQITGASTQLGAFFSQRGLAYVQIGGFGVKLIEKTSSTQYVGGLYCNGGIFIDNYGVQCHTNVA